MISALGGSASSANSLNWDLLNLTLCAVTQSLCISKYFLPVGCSSLLPVSAVGL